MAKHFIKSGAARFAAYTKQSNLFKSAFGSFSLKIIAGGATFVTSVILARLLGPKEFGIYAIIMAAVTLAAAIAALGLPSLVTREVARYEVHQQWSSLRGIVLTMHRWTITAALVLVIAAAGFVAVGWPIVNLGWATALPAMILIPLIALSQMRAAILRGLHWIVLADIPDLFIRPVLLVVAAGAIYYAKGTADSTDAVILQVICYGIAFVLGFQFLVNKFPEPARHVPADHHKEHWIREVQPFFWITVVFLIDSQVGLYLLGAISGPGQAGIFQVALQLVALVILGLSAVNAPLQPKLAAAMSRKDKVEAQRLLTEAARFGTSVAVIASLILIPFADEIVLLFGSKYYDAADVLRILVIGQLFNAAAGSCGIALNASGHQSSTMFGVIAALLVNFLLCLFVIPEWKAIGAAIAAVVSIMLWNVILVYLVHRHTGLHSAVVRMIRSY